MKLKGQGAMEYLMTYGWALLVIVVVAAALFALGVLNPATYKQKRCNGFQYFQYMDQQLKTGDFTIQLRNSNQQISINSVTFAGDSCVGDVMTIVDENGDVSNRIPSGKSFIISAEANCSFTPSPSLTGGSSYTDKTIIINYNITNGITGLTDTATCVGTVA
jgi:hypothetical protein